MASKRELWFVADGETDDGERTSVWVYRAGASIYISCSTYREHLCHPSVNSRERVLSEIYLVYKIKVISTKEPFEIARELNERSSKSPQDSNQ